MMSPKPMPKAHARHRDTTKVQRAVAMEEVPPEKWPAIVQRTILGGLFVALGVIGAIEWGWKWYVVLPAVVFGATLWSRQLITNTLKALLGPLKAYRRAMRDGDSA